MIIHPKARPLISTLSIPSPIKKYFSNLTWEIDLSNNTNPYGGGYAEYPDVNQKELKELYLKTIWSLNPPPGISNKNLSFLTPSNVLFTVGSMEGLDLILRTFCEPKTDLVCIPHPTFPAYAHWALIHSLPIKMVRLQGEDLNHINVENIIKAQPKLVFICNPNNPTGTKIDWEPIEKLCVICKGFVVVDEAYIEFSEQSSAIFTLHRHRNLIILRTFSKAWGLAGVRCGAVLADESIINALRYVQLPFGISSFSQEKVKERLLKPEKVFMSWKRIKLNREYLIEKLIHLKGVHKIFKSETNFMLLVLKGFQKTMQLLKKHKIQVMDCSSSVPNSIRVSLGNENQNITFLDVMYRASQ